MAKVYYGSQLLNGIPYIDSEHLNDDAVIESKIADGAVTTEKIADSNITTEKIADEAIIESKLSAEIQEKINNTTADYNELENRPSEKVSAEPVENPVKNGWYKINDNIYKYVDNSILMGYELGEVLNAGNKIHFDKNKAQELDDAIVAVYNETGSTSGTIMAAQSEEGIINLAYMIATEDDTVINVYFAILDATGEEEEDMNITKIYARHAGNADGLIFEDDGWQEGGLDDSGDYVIISNPGEILILVEGDPTWNGTVIGKRSGKAPYYDRVVLQSEIEDKISYTTEEPTSDNLVGFKFAILNSQPVKKYKGYIYIIDAAEPSTVVGNAIILGDESYILDNDVVFEEDCAIENNSIILE